jgi:type III secretion system YscQ/HrcQ family protein
MTLNTFIKKINDSPAWHRAKQYKYQWFYLDIQKIISTKNKQNITSEDYQIGRLEYLNTLPKLKDIWHLNTQFGDLYLINASDYLQAQTGIYPYHQEIHTQEWLILCIEKEIKRHWPHLQIKHLELLDQLPKKTHCWQLHLEDNDVYLAAAEAVWHKVLKSLTPLPKPQLLTQNIPLHLPVLLGQTELTKKEYQALVQGDIIYLDRAYFNHKGEGFCAIGEWQIELYYENEHFYFKQWDATSMSKIENPYDEIFEDDDDSNAIIEEGHDEDDERLESDEGNDEQAYDLEDFEATLGDDGDGEDDEDARAIKFKADRLNTQIKKQAMENEDVDDAGDEESAEQPKIMPPFKNIPVLLNFSLGQLKMSLAELSELTEGAVLPLASNDAAVTIYANHMAVARAEVIMIDERLAVQITEILEK